jgi:hypothetical protein
MGTNEFATRARVHACLDGELSPEALSPEEQRQLARFRAALGALSAELEAIPAPDLTAAVLRRIGEEPRREQPLTRLLRWLWTPRPVRIEMRPAYMAAFALLLLLVPLLRERTGGGAGGGNAPVYVQIQLHAPGAHRVQLAGSFTAWEPSVPLHEVQPGVWSAVVAVQPGVHDYTFLVDGQDWTVDPYTPQVDDAFGGRNNRLPVPDPLART